MDHSRRACCSEQWIQCSYVLLLLPVLGHKPPKHATAAPPHVSHPVTVTIIALSTLKGPASVPIAAIGMSFSNTSSSPASTSTRIPPSLTDELEHLTTAIQQVGDEIQTCKQASEERHVAMLARDEEQMRRTLTVQEQLAQMLTMTQEALRRNKEEPLAGE